MGNTLLAPGESLGKLHEESGACISRAHVSANSDDRSDSAAGIANMGVPQILVRAHSERAQQFTAGGSTTLNFNVEDVDFGGNFDPATGTFQAPVAGVYRVRACARFGTTGFGAGDTADVSLNVDGVGWSVNRVHASAQNDFHSCVDDLVTLAESVKLQASVAASGAATPRKVLGLGRYSTLLSVQRVSD